VFSGAFATGPDVDTRIDGRRMEGSLVTGNFFQVLGVSAARGRTLTPSDDELRHQAIVLSHRGWMQHFAGDAGVLGRTVLVNDLPFEIIGVMPEGFRGLQVAAPDFWTPLSLRSQLRRHEAPGESAAVSIVGRLKPGVSRGQALAELLVWNSRLAVEGSGGGPAPGLALTPRQGTVPLTAGSLLAFTPLFFAFGLVLMIGCANVANLLLARGVARQREIGIRLAIGASRRRIVWQLLTESLLLALAAAGLAFAISRVLLEGVVYALMTTWSPAFGDIRLAVPPADWRVALFLVAGAIGSTVVFALVPALQATRVELLRAVRGELFRDARPGRARNALVALQVTASVLLLVCAAVFLRSALAAATVDPGIRIDDIVTVNIVNERLRNAALEAVKREPTVASVAASWPGLLGARNVVADGSASAQAPAPKSTVPYQFVSPEFFGVLGIDLVRGRGFAPTERNADAAVAVVSESLARQLWPGLDAVGQVLRLEPAAGHEAREANDPPLLSRTVAVVGVARDVAGIQFGAARMARADIYVPIGIEAAKTSLTIRVYGDSERARRALVDRLAAIDPNIAEVTTLRTIAGIVTYFLGMAFWLTVALGGLALLLTLSGLFSVVSYLVEQRTREIGVRLALGATRRSIGALVLSQSARPVTLGLLLGGSLTAALGAALLATPAAAHIGSTLRLFDPVAYAASLFCIVTACACAALIPALRAGRIDPIAALRQD
jgi:predicted permease